MSIFISYSRDDQVYVNKLVEALTKSGLPVWLDNRIDYGETWPRVIEENLKKCQVFLLVMSPRSREAHWVNCELALALKLKKSIFPLLLEGNRWFEVGTIQTVDVQGGKLPPSNFFDKVCLELGREPKEVEKLTSSVDVEKLNAAVNAAAKEFEKLTFSVDVETLNAAVNAALTSICLTRTQVSYFTQSLTHF